jgi:ferric iron reductase protein FhuF
MSVDSKLLTLSDWGFYESQQTSAEMVFEGRALKTPDEWLTMLRAAAAKLDAEQLAVAASQFTKWYCRCCIGILHSLSIEDRMSAAALEELTLLFPGKPPFAVAANRPQPVALLPRPALRELVLSKLFADNFNIVFTAISRITHLRQSILWENAALYIHYFYRTSIERTEDAARRNVLQGDYDYILNAEASLFGTNHHSNPFIGTGAALRNTCCLRYMLPGAAACKVCPSPAARHN